MTIILSGVPCHECGRPVRVDRVGLHVTLREGRVAHDCEREPGKVLCGAAQRYGETCARTFGHAGSHRTRWAMDNAAVMATGHPPKARKLWLSSRGKNAPGSKVALQ